jgi:CDP-glycerol glycerophosphotransferase
MISVIVPIYNVEAYLRQCLSSLARQSERGFEAILVDDGSTDGSAAIAREFAAQDPRFRVVSQPNGGLGSARNTGIRHAHGEYLAFLDSDDELPSDAYRLLLHSLETTGSDFASGNVLRLTHRGRSQSRFLADVFDRTRLQTHVTNFRPLLADRTAWNKLWRRSFWGDRRFPEGVLHEDIPLVIPAQFEARAVDVIGDPVYLYRIREGGERSITQRRLEPRVLLDRLAAVESVSDWLAAHGPRGAQGWYHEQVLRDDLRLHLRVLDRADAAYRELFDERVNRFLDRVDPALLDAQWQLLREHRLDDLVESVRSGNRETLRTRLSRQIPERYRRRARNALRGLTRARSTD